MINLLNFLARNKNLQRIVLFKFLCSTNKHNFSFWYGVPWPSGLVHWICVLSRQNVGSNPDRDRGAYVLEQDTLP